MDRWVVAVALALPFAHGCGPEPPGGGVGTTAEVEGLAAAAAPAASRGQPPARLEVGEPLQRPILPGETHEVRLQLERGDFIELEVEQKGIDLQLTLIDPAGAVALMMDLPIADLGPESLIVVADVAGAHVARLQAAAHEDPEGTYLATLVARRPADAADRRRAAAAKTFYRAERAAWERRYREAVVAYREAIEQWRAAGDRFGEALSLDQAGDALDKLGDLAAATELHEVAAGLFADLDEPIFVAHNANHLGELYFKRGKMDLAFERHSQALEVRRRLGDRRGEGQTLNSLGLIHGVRGETQLALDHFAASLELLQRPEERRYRATALHDLGTLYSRLGKPQEAARRFKAAERIYAGLGDTRRQAFSLSQVGQLVFEAGDADQALGILTSSLELSRQHGATRSQIATLRRIGSIKLAQGDPEAARQRYLEALALLAELESPRSEGAVLADLGELSQRIGQAEEGLDYHRRALAIFERVGDPLREAAALLGEAASLRQLGRLEAALAPASRALEISEALRVRPFSEDLRLSFFTTAQHYFDFKIDLLMELHRAVPAAGYDAMALQVSERGRSRSLLDLLSEAGARIRTDAAPALLERERELQYRLNRGVVLMESESRSERQRSAAAEELERTLSELDAVRAAIRRESPRYAALTQPRPLDLGEIQRLLDRDTALLEFRLGRQRSFLWLVTRDSLESFELAPGDEIGSRAWQSHLLLKQPRRESLGRTRSLLCGLSEQLLRPAAGRLGHRRLAIVADGALEYVPFAVLPDPESADDCIDREPLVAEHEIVHLPSASTLAVLRSEAESREAPLGTIAVLADPVFSAADPRLEGREAPVGPPPSVTLAMRAGGAPLARLPHTRREAMAILAMVPPELSYRALDFDASKEVVLSGELAGYRIVHFATHGELDADQPALSRIVLSQVDSAGNRLEGSLRAHEIYNLRLPADLVVLSGCETALGREVRGEGLLGLARGFMYAGSSRVMVSLWKVSDLGTSELMREFYRGLLRQGLPPAAALRRAQLAVRARRPPPSYWAGFVLQGDWRQPAS